MRPGLGVRGAQLSGNRNVYIVLADALVIPETSCPLDILGSYPRSCALGGPAAAASTILWTIRWSPILAMAAGPREAWEIIGGGEGRA